MEQLYQNEPEHNKCVQDTGCKYLILMQIYQELTQYKISSEIINAVYVMSNRAIIDGTIKPYMAKDCFVYSASGIIQIVSGLTGISVFLEELYDIEKERCTHRLGYFGRTTGRGKRVNHFVRVGVNSNIIEHDSWKGGSKTARIGQLESYRWIYARLM